MCEVIQNDALIVRIRNLLSHTEERGCTQAEAAIFLEKASRIMASTGLTLADVQPVAASTRVGTNTFYDSPFNAYENNDYNDCENDGSDDQNPDSEVIPGDSLWSLFPAFLALVSFGVCTYWGMRLFLSGLGTMCSVLTGS